MRPPLHVLRQMRSPPWSLRGVWSRMTWVVVACSFCKRSTRALMNQLSGSAGKLLARGGAFLVGEYFSAAAARGFSECTRSGSA